MNNLFHMRAKLVKISTNERAYGRATYRLGVTMLFNTRQDTYLVQIRVAS